MLKIALKVAKVASILRRCEKPIFYTREYKGSLKDKAEIEELTVGWLKRLISRMKEVLGNYERERERERESEREREREVRND